MGKPRLLDQLRQTIRFRQYNYRTEQVYVYWVRRFILFHDKRHPADMGLRKSPLSSPGWRRLAKWNCHPEPSPKRYPIPLPGGFEAGSAVVGRNRTFQAA